ncbi:hypothetical protein LCGC14_2565750 [marine sediment metagenome]|uniref:HTH marR-type domain-containing protein n=1 Tax=marine sediment metagenome TaxID=412755 RepID=A0A0F9DBL8_9ZZZZ
MVRPRSVHPTPAELDVLKVIWDRGPSTVREMMAALKQRPARAYTSVMSLLSVMADKRLLKRTPRGRAFVYSARVQRHDALGGMVGDLLRRAFDGSASALVVQLLEGADVTAEELDEIARTIAAHKRRGE